MWDEIGQTLHQATVRVLSQFASLLPATLALIVAVLLSFLIAWIVAFGLRRFLHGVHFDEKLKHWGLTGIADWSPRDSPAMLVTRVVGWAIVLLGFILGLAAFDAALTSRLAFDLFSKPFRSGSRRKSGSRK